MNKNKALNIFKTKYKGPFEYKRSSLYVIKELPRLHRDHVMIKKHFRNAKHKGREIKTHKIFRVKKRRPKRDKSKISKENSNNDVTKVTSNDDATEESNLMLFHGTNLHSTVGILNKGFSAGEYNGVSMTTSAAVAVRFSLESITNPKTEDSFLFLSEILESDSLVEVAAKDQIFEGITTKVMRQHQFEKRVRTRNGGIITDGAYERDSKEMKVLNVEESSRDGENCYISDESLVVPRYLVQCYVQLY